MKITLSEKNIAKIEEAINSAQGKATARTITVKDIFQAADEIEGHLGISKAAMTGISASVDLNAELLPKAYKWTAESTQFDLVKTSSGWTITSIRRSALRQNRRRIILKLTDRAKAAIIENASIIE